MDQMKLIDLMSVIQEHVDQGISVILFVNSDYYNKRTCKILYLRTSQRI